VDVLGHDHVADQPKAMSVSNITENSNEYTACASRAEKRQAVVATECDEMQMPESVDASEAFRHEANPGAPPSQTEDGAPATTYSQVKYRDGIMPCEAQGN
jgi:hypothetical protein